MNLVEKGSQTAKNGFKNEHEICEKFNNWQNDIDVQKWLIIMNYNLSEIEFVKADVIHGFKADINVKVQIKMKKIIDIENIQIKLVSNRRGFNQIDKRWLKNYKQMWNMPEDVYLLLKYFTGEESPYKSVTRDKSRQTANMLQFKLDPTELFSI